MSLVLGGLDVVGDDDVDGEGLTTMGAAGMRRRIKVPTPRWMRATTSQGVSRPQEELDLLPFDVFTFTNSGPAPIAFTGRLIARPQRPFRGERFVMGALDATTGVDVSNGVVIDPAIYVGAVQVGAAQGATPLSVFRPDAFGIRLSVPPAGQGTDIIVNIRSLFPIPVGNSVLVTCTLIGRAMR